MRILPYGDRAVLVELDDPDAVLGLRAQLSQVEGIGELIPGARTLLVEFDPTVISPVQLHERLVGSDATPGPGSVRPVGPELAGQDVVVRVHYDGTDLKAVAAETGLSVADVIARHSGATYVVAFCGFAPGFAYLRGLDPALHLPRLAAPRTSVPAGSVAIAAEFTGVYPRPSPGGWRLLGHTDEPMWDLTRTPPARLVPGATVRFEPA
jgi:KipI family sensor histidine kinase inhibitor